MLATGSSPTRVPAFALDDPRVMDSTAALRLDDVPGSLLVVGGGYIGLELGTVYAALGSKVTVVELTDGLLPGVDRDLVRPLQTRLASQFHKIYLGTKVAKIEAAGPGIRAVLEGEEVTDKEPLFDRVLVAVGRKPNTATSASRKPGPSSMRRVLCRWTGSGGPNDPSIFAIGDVAGEPMLAHKAAHEGKIAVEAILGEPSLCDWRAMPAVVFTDPEIAWCGLTETEAQKQKREVKTARFPWAASGRAMTLGRTEGLTKLLVDPESDQVLGVGIVGAGAGELIAEAVLAIETATTAQRPGHGRAPAPDAERIARRGRRNALRHGDARDADEEVKRRSFPPLVPTLKDCWKRCGGSRFRSVGAWQVSLGPANELAPPWVKIARFQCTLKRAAGGVRGRVRLPHAFSVPSNIALLPRAARAAASLALG